MLETFTILLPQTVLAVLACLFFLGGSFPIPSRSWGPLALGALLCAAGCLFYSSGQEFHPTISSLVTHDKTAIGFQWCSLGLMLLFVLMSQSQQSESSTSAELYGLLLLVTSGLMLVSAAQELILLFLGLELISVPTYVLLYLGRRDYSSQEAAVKYFLLSILSAAVLLYGFSFLYGLTGSTHLGAIRQVLAAAYQAPESGFPPAGGSTLGLVALVLIFAGLGFKVAAVPFHFYAPDVYQGTSAFNAGLLAVVPKAAGFIVLIRVALETMVGFEASGERIALILAVITMTGGNCLALLQTNVRRLLAYSSIANAGYMLIGIAVGFWDVWNGPASLDASGELPGGVRACLFYLFSYSVASAGLFAVLMYLAGPGGKQVEHVEDLTGLARTQPFVAGAAALFLFSLAGVPPLLGFWGKLSLFADALNVRVQGENNLPELHQGFTLLAIIGAINAAVAAAYYLRMIAVMFLNDSLSTHRPTGGRPALAAIACTAVLVLGLGLMPRPIFKYLGEIPVAAVAKGGTVTHHGGNSVDTNDKFNGGGNASLAVSSGNLR